MNSVDWLAYFRQNRLDRRGVAWHEGIHLEPGLQSPLAHSFTLLERTMLRHGISDLRVFLQDDMRFLESF